MSNHIERLKALDQIEKDIASALEYAGLSIAELGKDKLHYKPAENHAQTFLKTVTSIESNLMKQINYLSQVVTTHPHTGSSYGAQKDWQTSIKRLEHVTSRLDELEKIESEQQTVFRQNELRRALSHQSSFPPMGSSHQS